MNMLPGSLTVEPVPDLIDLAFNALAAYVTEVRIEDLAVLRNVRGVQSVLGYD